MPGEGKMVESIIELKAKVCFKKTAAARSIKRIYIEGMPRNGTAKERYCDLGSRLVKPSKLVLFQVAQNIARLCIEFDLID